MKAYEFEGKMGEVVVEIPVPESLKEKCLAMRAELIEKAAEQSDELMEKFFEAGDLSVADIKKGLRA
jgi:elongation factor G